MGSGRGGVAEGRGSGMTGAPENAKSTIQVNNQVDWADDVPAYVGLFSGAGPAGSPHRTSPDLVHAEMRPVPAGTARTVGSRPG
jgi:hypothetical protein